MSYILEALMQAQLERQSRGIPGLYTIQTLPRLRPEPRRRWPLVAAGVAGLSGLLAVGFAWMQPWHRDTLEISGPIITSASVAAPDAHPKPAVVSLETTPGLLSSVEPRLRAAGPDAAPSVAKAPDTRRKHQHKRRKGKIQIAAIRPAAQADTRIYSITELPVELQKVASSISIAGFAHSDNPKERTAIINNRALREGEEVSGGLRVERIADDGVVFNLKGYRFRKGRT